MSNIIEFEYIALKPNTTVMTSKPTHAEMLSPKQGWKVWREEGASCYLGSWKGGPVNEFPQTSVASAVRKRVQVDEPAAAPPSEPPPAEEPKDEPVAAASKEKPKSKLPPRRGAAPVADVEPVA